MFQTLFCERFKCTPSQYEQRAFRGFLYLHARLVAPFLRAIKPDFFAPDLKFIRRLGMASDMREATGDLLDFRDVNVGGSSFWRGGLKLRVSSRKAGKVARELFSEAAARTR
jgi:hypothetical protein